jgi:hypothetical protein
MSVPDWPDVGTQLMASALLELAYGIHCADESLQGPEAQTYRELMRQRGELLGLRRDRPGPRHDEMRPLPSGGFMCYPTLPERQVRQT